MKDRLYNLASCYLIVFGVLLCCGIYTIGMHGKPIHLHERMVVTRG